MKIKKLLVLILSIITIIMCVCFAGCEDSRTPIDNVPQESISNSAFCLVSKDNLDDDLTLFIVYHKETKVMYMITRFHYGNASGVSTIVMVDENGKPLLYNGD